MRSSVIRDEIIRRELSPVSWRIGAHPGGKIQNFAFELVGICGRMPHEEPPSFCLVDFFVCELILLQKDGWFLIFDARMDKYHTIQGDYSST